MKEYLNQTSSSEDIGEEFRNMESNPDTEETFQKVCFDYLRFSDKEWFDKTYTGELDEEGYLIEKKTGEAKTKPSQNISGEPMKWVVDETKHRLEIN